MTHDRSGNGNAANKGPMPAPALPPNHPKTPYDKSTNGDVQKNTNSIVPDPNA